MNIWFFQRTLDIEKVGENARSIGAPTDVIDTQL